MIWVGVIALCTFAIWMIRRDSHELPSPIRWTLSLLRVFAIICVVTYLVNPGQRSESRLITNSRLAVLIDNSLSMGLPAYLSTASNNTTRMDSVIQWLAADESLDRLRQQHDLSIYRFGDTATPIPLATWTKEQSTPVSATASLAATRSSLASVLPVLAWLFLITAAVFCISWLMAVFGSGTTNRSWLLMSFILSSLFALVLTGIVDLSNPEQTVWDALRFSQADSEPSVLETPPIANNASTDKGDAAEKDAIVWTDVLRPQGTSTTIGAAIQFIINKERGGPLAGVVVISDGQSNSGLPLPTAVAAAENANVAVFPVGVGSTEVLKNIAIADLQAPPRVLPKDDFRLAVVLKSFGFENRQVRVTLTSTADQEAVPDGETAAKTIEDEQTIELASDGTPIPLEFDLRAKTEGKRRYRVEVENLEGDANRKDNAAETVVNAIQRETKIMLIAGGPSREFRFLRNQLYRDDNFSSDVWLQSASIGADQEADRLLEAFPETTEELFEYDCIIAFDPDWRELTDRQTEMLERWVAEKAGGLILVAGPVNTPEWTRRPRGDEAIDRIRDLYPVAFFNQGSARLKLGRFGGDTAYPLAFTREGRASRYLWLGDSAAESSATWGQFEGVFGYYAVNEPKAGADVLANFSDQSTAVNGDFPIYLASHFYGAGRVFFQASGEMWRVRRVEVDFFQDYYDQLIRWASQGRLIRDSQRGVLLTDRDRCWVGDQIRVQAILKDAQNDPLMSDSVIASLVSPDGQSRSIELRSAGAATRPGTFDGICVVDQEGEYQVILPIPDSATNDVLIKSFQAAIPDLEKLKPQRNDSAMQDLADRTGGHYFVGMESLAETISGDESLEALIPPQDQETFLTGTLNRIFQKKLMIWLLTWFAIAMSIEWIVRRGHKLS